MTKICSKESPFGTLSQKNQIPHTQKCLKYSKTANEKSITKRVVKKTRASKRKRVPNIRKNEKARDLVHIRDSNIPCAGFGAFASSFIPKRTTLGQYKGKLCTKKQYDDLNEKDCCYIFEFDKQVGKKRKKYFIDARSKRYSNWTRYVNGAKSKEQQKKVNIETYQYGGKVFYRTCEDVQPNEELLVDYGSDYWTEDEEESSDSEDETKTDTDTDTEETEEEEEEKEMEEESEEEEEDSE